MATPVDPQRLCLAGAWGEASPQVPPEGAEGAKKVPPEARWTAGRGRGASQPWAEGAKGEGDFSQTVLRFQQQLAAGGTAFEGAVGLGGLAQRVRALDAQRERAVRYRAEHLFGPRE